MGFELAAIHAAAKRSRLRAIIAHLVAQPKGWLSSAALDAAADVVRDYKEWAG